MSTLGGDGSDPRHISPLSDPVPPLGPSAVARAAPATSWALPAAAFALLGLCVFLWLGSQRTGGQDQVVTAQGVEGRAPAPSPAPQPLPVDPGLGTVGPPGLPASMLADSNIPIMDRQAGPPAVMAAMGPATIPPPPPPASAADRRRAPAVVVDLGQGGFILPAAGAATPGVAAALAAGAAGSGAEGDGKSPLSSEEQFAERISAVAEPERARATTLRNLDALVPQGALISAVLETAINSDLPGFARAVVSRDVKSFDGTQVLIPRGSRLIGQYKSGVALGASRVFVIWTRVLRPDGVSVQIASPGADSLGRAGMTGEVDRHFFTRFGGSILLSVLNAGVAAATKSDSASIYIGSTADASNLAAAAFDKDGAAGPTIRTPQGSAVRVFVARDLDFSGVRR